MIVDICQNLIFYTAPKKKEEQDRLEKMKFKLQLSTGQDLKGYVSQLQTRVRFVVCAFHSFLSILIMLKVLRPQQRRLNSCCVADIYESRLCLGLCRVGNKEPESIFHLEDEFVYGGQLLLALFCGEGCRPSASVEVFYIVDILLFRQTQVLLRRYERKLFECKKNEEEIRSSEDQ